MKTLNAILSLLGLALLAIFWFQNLEPQVDAVLLGQSSRSMSLSTMLLVFYLGGVGVGLLLNASWAFEDAFLMRRIKRQVMQQMGMSGSASSARGDANSHRSRIDNSFSSEKRVDDETPIQPDILAEGEEPGDWLNDD
ncbi:MAG: hypothetical protein AAF974_11760 [Cyanobacteria bacterium P01_E01_bin.34]